MNKSTSKNQPDPSRQFRVGDWAEVRSAEEILATLDDGQSVAGLPFMPEMLQYCGKRFRIYKSAHKTADTIELFSIRRLTNTVHLEELRCDGAAHGGCQAGCLLFWKDSWLKRVHPNSVSAGGDAEEPAPAANSGGDNIPEVLARGTMRTALKEGAERYRCQATEMLNATTGVKRRERFDPRFYIKDLASGNVKLSDFIRFGALAALNAFLQRWFGIRCYPRLRGLAGKKTPTLELNLQPGEQVFVKSKQDIQQTLDPRLRNRGLNFDHEMVPYCGKGPFRVLHRVERLISEKTGEMVKLNNPCIVFEGLTCSGRYLYQRMFSQRREFMFFREIWLERAVESTVLDCSLGSFGASLARLAGRFGFDNAVASRAIRQMSGLRFFKQFDQCSRVAVTILALLIVALVGFMDYISGVEVSCAVFYLLAIGAAAWFVGRGSAIFISIASVAVSFWADVASGAHFSNVFVPAWNAISLVSLYLVVVWLLTALHSLMQEVEVRVVQPTAVEKK